jgi:hypothetical protein
MILIDIFKENHRSSEKTPHPAPHSVVGAANLAADRRAASKAAGAKPTSATLLHGSVGLRSWAG